MTPKEQLEQRFPLVSIPHHYELISRGRLGEQRADTLRRVAEEVEASANAPAPQNLDSGYWRRQMYLLAAEWRALSEVGE